MPQNQKFHVLSKAGRKILSYLPKKKTRFVELLRFCTAPEPPLCKGRWQKSLIFVGGIVTVESCFFRHTTGKFVTFYCTIPQSRLAPCQLPLHKGAFAAFL